MLSYECKPAGVDGARPEDSATVRVMNPSISMRHALPKVDLAFYNTAIPLCRTAVTMCLHMSWLDIAIIVIELRIDIKLTKLIS